MFRSSEVKSRNNAALQQSGPPGAPPVSLHNQPGGGGGGRDSATRFAETEAERTRLFGSC